jgi:hypothetical protein
VKRRGGLKEYNGGDELVQGTLPTSMAFSNETPYTINIC